LKFAVNQVVWRIRVPKLNLDFVPKSCKYAVNQVVWRITVPNLNLDLAPKSCKYDVSQVVWRIRVPKLNLDLRCKPGELEDKDPKPESGFSPKIMQKTLKTR